MQKCSLFFVYLVPKPKKEVSILFLGSSFHSFWSFGHSADRGVFRVLQKLKQKKCNLVDSVVSLLGNGGRQWVGKEG